jgi:hypothetical protein
MTDVTNRYLYTFEVQQVGDVAGTLNTIAGAAGNAARQFGELATNAGLAFKNLSSLSGVLSAASAGAAAAAQTTAVNQQPYIAPPTSIPQAGTYQVPPQIVQPSQQFTPNALTQYPWNTTEYSPYLNQTAQMPTTYAQAQEQQFWAMVARGQQQSLQAPGYPGQIPNYPDMMEYAPPETVRTTMDPARIAARKEAQLDVNQQKAIESWRARQDANTAAEAEAKAAKAAPGTAAAKGGGIFGEQLGRRIQFMAEWYVFAGAINTVAGAVSHWAEVQGALDKNVADFSAYVSPYSDAVQEYKDAVMEVATISALTPGDVATGVLAEKRVAGAPPGIAMTAAMLERVTGGAYDNEQAQKELQALAFQFSDKSLMQIMDAFMGALSETNVRPEQLFGLLDLAGGWSAMFNMTLEQTLGMVAGTMTVTGEEGGGIEQLMKRMEDVYAGKDLAPTLKSFGIETMVEDKETGKQIRRPLPEVLRDVSKLEKPQREEIARAMGSPLGQMAPLNFLNILNNYKMIEEASTRATTSQGLFVDVFSRQMDTLPAKIEAVGSAWDIFLLNLGNTNQAKGSLQWLSDFLLGMAEQLEGEKTPVGQAAYKLAVEQNRLRQIESTEAWENAPLTFGLDVKSKAIEQQKAVVAQAQQEYAKVLFGTAAEAYPQYKGGYPRSDQGAAYTPNLGVISSTIKSIEDPVNVVITNWEELGLANPKDIGIDQYSSAIPLPQSDSSGIISPLALLDWYEAQKKLATKLRTESTVTIPSWYQPATTTATLNMPPLAGLGAEEVEKEKEYLRAVQLQKGKAQLPNITGAGMGLPIYQELMPGVPITPSRTQQLPDDLLAQLLGGGQSGFATQLPSYLQSDPYIYPESEIPRPQMSYSWGQDDLSQYAISGSYSMMQERKKWRQANKRLPFWAAGNWGPITPQPDPFTQGYDTGAIIPRNEIPEDDYPEETGPWAGADRLMLQARWAKQVSERESPLIKTRRRRPGQKWWETAQSSMAQETANQMEGLDYQPYLINSSQASQAYSPAFGGENLAMSDWLASQRGPGKTDRPPGGWYGQWDTSKWRASGQQERQPGGYYDRYDEKNLWLGGLGGQGGQKDWWSGAKELFSADLKKQQEQALLISGIMGFYGVGQTPGAGGIGKAGPLTDLDISLEEKRGMRGVTGPGPGLANQYLEQIAGNTTIQVTRLADIDNSISSGLKDLVGKLEPTKVTPEDVTATKAGTYKDKWDEPVRRVRAAVEKRVGMSGAGEWDSYAAGLGVDLSSPESATKTGAAFEKKFYAGELDPKLYKGAIEEAAKTGTGKVATPKDQLFLAAPVSASQGKEQGENIVGAMVPAMTQKMKDMKAVDQIVGAIAIDDNAKVIGKMGYSFGEYMITGTTQAFKDKFVSAIVLAVVGAITERKPAGTGEQP